MAELQEKVLTSDLKENPFKIKYRKYLHTGVDILSRLKKHPLAFVGLIVLLVYFLVAVFAPFLCPHDPTESNISTRLKPPVFLGGDWSNPLGTDSIGRDLLSRIIYGSRVSLLIGVITVSISVMVGSSLGAVAGYFQGRFDALLSRLADLLLAFPFLIFTIGAMAFMGPGFWNLIIALSFKSWVEFYRLVRGEMLSEKNKEYVEAARALGQNDFTIILSEIMPNIFHSILVLATLRLGYLIVAEASLSFLGLGVPPEIPAWGSMIQSGKNHMINAFWVSTLPGAALVILVLSINLLGEGLRDILDPRLRID